MSEYSVLGMIKDIILRCQEDDGNMITIDKDVFDDLIEEIDDAERQAFENNN